jgi:hypothetical protein
VSGRSLPLCTFCLLWSNPWGAVAGVLVGEELAGHGLDSLSRGEGEKKKAVFGLVCSFREVAAGARVERYELFLCGGTCASTVPRTMRHNKNAYPSTSRGEIGNK